MKSPRTPKTEAAYRAFKKQRLASTGNTDQLELSEEVVIKEYKNWLIIENRFPYDAMTSINHMLVPKRTFDDFYKATDEERDEYHKIIQELAAADYYDAIVENFPRSRSLSRHSHIHLVRWKYTNENGKNISDS